MFLLYFVNAFQSSITSNLSAFITSGFESHSLIPVIYIVSSVMSSATYMPLAKILNVWDRSIGFLIMVVFATVGLVLSATCTGITTYCISQVGVLVHNMCNKKLTIADVLHHWLCWCDLQYRRDHS